MGEVGCSSRNSETCVWWENVSSSHPANIHLTPCSQSSGLRPRQKPQTPDREESRGKQAAALPTDPDNSAPELTGAAGTQGCLLSRPWGPLGTAGFGCHPYRRDTGRNSGSQELSWRENPAQSSLPPAYFKPQAEIEGQGKPCGPPQGKTASMMVPRPHFLSALHHRLARDSKPGSGWVGWVSQDSLPGQVAPASGLEANDDIGDLQVPLLLQVG